MARGCCASLACSSSPRSTDTSTVGTQLSTMWVGSSNVHNSTLANATIYAHDTHAHRDDTYMHAVLHAHPCASG